MTGDKLVATADGWRRIDGWWAYRPVIGAEGMPHLVTRVFPTGRAVFRADHPPGYRVRITADHRVLTAERVDVAVVI